MIPNDAEYFGLGYRRMPPTEFLKGLMISALCGGNQIIIRDLIVTTGVILIVRARS
jgi:hypothetical protein